MKEVTKSNRNKLKKKWMSVSKRNMYVTFHKIYRKIKTVYCPLG